MTVKKGVIQGPSHKNGGVPFTVDGQPGFEAEGGERIISKVGTSKLDNLAKNAKTDEDFAALGKIYAKEMNKGDKNTKEQNAKANDGALLDEAFNVATSIGFANQETAFDFDPIGSLQNNILSQALTDAQKDLPAFNYSRESDFDGLINRQELGATYGLEPQTKALYNRQVDESYKAAMSSIKNSGYSASQQMALGSSLAMDYMENKTKVAIYNDNAILQKQALLGESLAADYSRELAKFDIKYQEELATKEAAAEYVRTAIENYLANEQYQAAYGPGSEYDNLMIAQRQYMTEMQGIMELQRQNYETMLQQNIDGMNPETSEK